MWKNTRERIYLAGVLVLALILISATMLQRMLVQAVSIIPDSCIFQIVLGMYCPGCGGTRAVLALLRGEILQSIWYHPLVFYCVALCLCAMVSHTMTYFFPKYKGMKFRAGYLYGALVVLGANFIVKNVLKLVFGICMI